MENLRLAVALDVDSVDSQAYLNGCLNFMAYRDHPCNRIPVLLYVTYGRELGCRCER